jgi:hypothetical protein
VELREVASFLRAQHVQDGELTCGNAAAEPLYPELGVKPSTRYPYLSVMVAYFPDQVASVRLDLIASRQRFVVSGVRPPGHHPSEEKETPSPDRPLSRDLLPNQIGVFPWTEPVVFRTAHYVVHRVNGPVSRLAPESLCAGP